MSPTDNQNRTISVWQAAWLVAKREVLSQVRSKSFVISTVVMVLSVFGLTVVGGIFADRAMNPEPIAVTSQTAPLIAGNPLLTEVPVHDAEEALGLVEDETVSAALLPSDSSLEDPLGFYIVAKESAPEALTASVLVAPRVEILEPDEDDSGGFDPIQYIITMVFGVIFLMSAMTYGSTIAQNTVVEKQTRTVEILLSAIPATALLGGKILGNSLLAITQTALVLLSGYVGLLITGQSAILSMVSASAIWFVVFFIFGFVLVASIFAASASLVSRIEDTGSVLSPVMMLTMLPYFVVIIFGTNQTVMTVASYFPFTSTVAMPLRMVTGAVPLWEPLLALLILVASDLLVVVIAARIYRASLLKMGPRIRLREAWASRD
ncbi:MAG: ABC transporter permease [Scrofimicrobium sp.]